MNSGSAIFEFKGPFGVPVEVDRSLVLLFGFLLLMSNGSLVNSAIFGGMLVVSIFLHEFGHAWGGLVQGVPVRRVVLHGGGGFCETARSASARESEFIVAMGPIVNLALWALASLGQWMIYTSALSGNLGPNLLFVDLYSYLGLFAWMNLALFIFNLIPVQPLDGGKLLHLGLLRVLSQGAAQRVAGRIGLVLSILWIPAAIIAYVEYGWILFFIPSIPAHYRMARGQLA